MHLKSDMRQKNTQETLDFNSTPTGEARVAGREVTESFSARRAPENPASTNQLMEEVCEGENLKQALQLLVPGTTAWVRRFSKSQVKLRPCGSERVLPFASNADPNTFFEHDNSLS